MTEAQRLALILVAVDRALRRSSLDELRFDAQVVDDDAVAPTGRVPVQKRVGGVVRGVRKDVLQQSRGRGSAVVPPLGCKTVEMVNRPDDVTPVTHPSPI